MPVELITKKRYNKNKIMTKAIFSQNKYFISCGIVIIILVIYLVVALTRPMSQVSATVNDLALPHTSAATITWPNYGEAAVGASGYGVLVTHGEQKSVPIASIAKTVLALSVMKEKPFKLGESGPNITMTADDVTLYKSALAQNGSVVPVVAGEKLSEYQILQALLIPSGDNIADTLANWAFGSQESYLAYANDLAKKLGMVKTHMADASGLSPQTVSSARDLVILGGEVMQEPVLAKIVNMPQTTLPQVGVVKNYNTDLGLQNIIGIKTGNTNEAGGCFLFATKTTQNGQDLIMIAAILGATSRNQALADSVKFLKANPDKFRLTTAVGADEIIGTYKTPWAKKVNIVLKDNLQVFSGSGIKLTSKINLATIKGAVAKGKKVGTITISTGSEKVSAPLVLEESIPEPSIFWRLVHP